MPPRSPSPSTRARRATRAVAAAIAVLAPGAAAAQTVVGRVLDARGAPLASAVVALLDSARRPLGGALTDGDGAFELRAPRPGRYWVVGERVGSAGASSPPLTLADGDTARVTLTMGQAPQLAALRITARERCRVRPEEGSRAAALWADVRAALTNASLALDTRAFAFTLERVQRTREPERGRLRHEERTLAPGERTLFASAPAAELQRLGWVRATRLAASDTMLPTQGMPAAPASADDEEAGAPNDGVQFFGPDAHTLVDDAFVDAHCVRTTPAPKKRPGQIGLAFEPVSRRQPRLPDIRGTLWVDTATRELRDLEFTYTDLAPALARHAPGGSVRFARLPNGLWYVERWELRMPVLQPSGDERRVWFEGMREVGGRTLLDGDLPPVPSDVALLTGMVVDSTRDLAPVAGARVRVAGTPYTAVTNAFGLFRLELPQAGTATLTLEHPRLVALGVPAASAASLVLGRETMVAAAFPSVATVRARLCGPNAPPGSGVIVGAVWWPPQEVEREMAARLARVARGERGQPRHPEPVPANAGAPWRGGRVELQVPRDAAGSDAAGSDATGSVTVSKATGFRVARTDHRGHFRYCGVPTGRPLRLHVPTGRQQLHEWEIVAQPDGAAVLELVRGLQAVHPRHEEGQAP
jgi:hypothetical protein